MDFHGFFLQKLLNAKHHGSLRVSIHGDGILGKVDTANKPLASYPSEAVIPTDQTDH